jgi:hypothetical protein
MICGRPMGTFGSANNPSSVRSPIVLDKEGKPTGEYRYDGSVANRALELLGKQQGLFIDRHEVGQPNEFANWTDEELEAFIKGETKRLGIVSNKTQH